MKNRLKAGAAIIDITPADSQFLCGYPHVERYSTGVHDPLISSALYLTDNKTEVLFVANDIVEVPDAIVSSARKRISAESGIDPACIMITAMHTHSGPVTRELTAWGADGVIPQPDEKYLDLLENGIVRAGVEACSNAQPAKIGLGIADGKGVGTNRHDPSGTSDPDVPVLMVKSLYDDNDIACMLVCAMHPTVMHEDSKLVSADFPGMTRQYLSKYVLDKDCPILYHTGAAGNQSPRHVTKANTFEEAERIGHLLGKAVESVIPQISYTSDISLACVRDFSELKRRDVPSITDAEIKLEAVKKKYEQLKQNNAPSQEIRTAECDLFGAEGMLELAGLADSGKIDTIFEKMMPYEMQIIKIGPWNFIGWQGEIFVEYSLKIKSEVENTFVISLANGCAPGYIVTQDAFDKGGYEAAGSLLHPESGRMIIEKTLKILLDD